MGLLQYIVKHEFCDLENKTETKAFLEETVRRLCRAFNLSPEHVLYDVWESDLSEDDDIFQISLPMHNTELYLHRGAWEAWSLDKYDDLVKEVNGHFPYRERIFDVVRALGAHEVWYWNRDSNSVLYSDCETFEAWLDRAAPDLGHPKEFDIKEIIGSHCGDLDLWWCYHDTFADCHEQVARLAAHVAPDRLLGLHQLVENYLLVEQPGGVNLLHKDTLEPLFPEPVEEIWESGNDVQIRKSKE